MLLMTSLGDLWCLQALAYEQALAGQKPAGFIEQLWLKDFSVPFLCQDEPERWVGAMSSWVTDFCLGCCIHMESCGLICSQILASTIIGMKCLFGMQMLESFS